ncbi:zeta toxin family protein [Kribbella sp. NPDC056861]|uniref:zeta toxin family protein n=1 Tax=Kribbella sp. NPDC056861 TaxID=3154857 RepID=UPI00341D4E96
MVNVLAGLGLSGGSAEQGVAYEVAMEGAGQAIGFYAELIAQAEAAGESTAVAGWRKAQQAWAVRRRELAPADLDEIAAIHSDGEDLLAEPDDEPAAAQPVVGEDLLDGAAARPGVWSDEESDRIFRERIVPDELTGISQLRPVVVIVAGQPGDGSAVVAALAQDALDRRGGSVVVGPDRYLPHHPDFHRVMSDQPTDGRELASAGRRWAASAAAYACSKRFDVVLQDADDVEHSARQFRAAGYQVEVAIVAVPEAISRFGVLDRHVRALEAYGYGRLSDPARHDVLRTAATIDHEQAVEVIAVLRPNGELLYGNQRTADGLWQRRPATVDAITAERARPWTVLESRLFLEAVATFERRGRSAPIPWIREEATDGARAVTALARPQLHPDAVTLHIATAGVPAPD